MAESAQEQARAPELDRSDWPTLTARMHPANLRMVDVAAALAGKPRAHYVEEHVLAAARRTLVEHGVDLADTSDPG